MSVKHAILGLIYEEPCYGYEIKTKFDHMVHGQWPLNVGQIYSTMDRLVRDGLVQPIGLDEQDRKQYAITEQGREELQRWLLEPVERSLLKDDFLFKLLCAKQINFSEQQEMIKQQRTMIMQNILSVTKLRNQLKAEGNQSMYLLLEGGLLHLEADIEWLHLIESELE